MTMFGKWGLVDLVDSLVDLVDSLVDSLVD
jgi:hypothetical protein